jgi:hypothetical protein
MSEANEKPKKFLTWKDDKKEWEELTKDYKKEFFKGENEIIRQETAECLKKRINLDKCWEMKGKLNCDEEFSQFLDCSLKLYYNRPLKAGYSFPIEQKLFQSIHEKRLIQVKSNFTRETCRIEVGKYIDCLESKIEVCDQKNLKFCFENVLERSFE